MVLYYDIQKVKRKTGLFPFFFIPITLALSIIHSKKKRLEANLDISAIDAKAAYVAENVDVSLLRRKYLLNAPLSSDELIYIKDHKAYFDDIVKKQSGVLFDQMTSLTFVVEAGKLVPVDRVPSENIFEVTIDLSSRYFYTEDVNDLKSIELKAKEMYTHSMMSLNKFSFYSKNGVICEKSVVLRNKILYDQALVFGHNYICQSDAILVTNKPVRVFPVISTNQGDYISEAELMYKEMKSANLYIYRLDGGSQDYLSLVQRLSVSIKRGKRLIFGLFGPKKKKYINTMRLDADLITGNIKYYVISPSLKGGTLVHVRSSNGKSK